MSNAQKIEDLKAKQAKLDEAIKAKKAKIAQRISHLKAEQTTAERKADVHIKAALGGAVLKIQQEKITLNPSLDLIFQIADSGIQKDGLAREKFVALRSSLKPPAVGTAQ